MDQTEIPTIPYSQYYIAFLDVLGFQNLVFSKDANDKRKIEGYFENIKQVVSFLEGIKNKRRLKSIIISDSVILSIPFGDSESERIYNLRHLCVAIAKIQYALAKHDIWLRGAISSGDAYFNHNENLVVGPAYVNAYLLENNLSIYPRVILDNKIIGELGRESTQEVIDLINNNDFSDWNSDILYNWKKRGQGNTHLKQDIPLFIDYFSALIGNLQETQIIIKNIGKNIYSDNTIYPKYRWLVDYLICHCNDLMARSNSEETKNLYKYVYLHLISL